nr:MAG TPA: hypothetical protein [Bacteriophage sp.]
MSWNSSTSLSTLVGCLPDSSWSANSTIPKLAIISNFVLFSSL